MYETNYEMVETIRSLAAQGLSSKEIALIVGKTPKAVQKYFRRHSIPCLKRGGPEGLRNGAWKGGRKITKEGYTQILCKDHPFADNHGYVLEHRLIMEATLGRYLQPFEVVHHKDKNKNNNCPENLEVFENNAEHLRHELKGRVPNWSAEGFANMCKPRRLSSNQKEISTH